MMIYLLSICTCTRFLAKSVSLCVSLQEWKVTRLSFEYDPEPYGKERDGAIIKMAQEFGVETVVRNSHTLYNLDRFVAR